MSPSLLSPVLCCRCCVLSASAFAFAVAAHGLMWLLLPSLPSLSKFSFLRFPVTADGGECRCRALAQSQATGKLLLWLGTRRRQYHNLAFCSRFLASEQRFPLRSVRCSKQDMSHPIPSFAAKGARASQTSQCPPPGCVSPAFLDFGRTFCNVFRSSIMAAG